MSKQPQVRTSAAEPSPFRRPAPAAAACLLLLGLGPLAAARSADTETARERELRERVESAESRLGRHGAPSALGHLESMLAEASELGRPLLVARIRLLLGRGLEHSRAHLELAAETFREHDHPGREALARLHLGRALQRLSIRTENALFASEVFDDAVAAFEEAVRRSRTAGDALTEAEAHWALGRLHRVADALGPAIEHFERAARSFESGGHLLPAVVAEIDAARSHASAGDLHQAGSILEAARRHLEGRGDADLLKALLEEQASSYSPQEAERRTLRAAAELRERGYPDTASHLERVASFFRKRGRRIAREGWSQADLEAMSRLHQRSIQDRQDRPRPESPTSGSLSGDRGPLPLISFIEEHPDFELLRRAFEHAVRAEVADYDLSIRRLELEHLLAGDGEGERDALLADLVAEARESGYMPELPVRWFLHQFEQVPDQYRAENALAMWADLKAGEVYAHLHLLLGSGFEGIPPQRSRALPVDVPEWNVRYCENRSAALEQVGAADAFCDLRLPLSKLAEEFRKPKPSPGSALTTQGTVDTLREMRRRLVALLDDHPSRLTDELAAGDLEPFFQGLFFRERNPAYRQAAAEAARLFSAALPEAIAVAEAFDEAERLHPSPAVEHRIAEVRCVLAHQLAVHAWLEKLHRQTIESQARVHREWREDVLSALKKLPPTGYQKVGDESTYQPTWGVGCTGDTDPSFVTLREVDPDPAWAPKRGDERLTDAWRALNEGRAAEALRMLRAHHQVGIERPELRASVLDGIGRALLDLGRRGEAVEALAGAVEALEEVVGSLRRPSSIAAYAGGDAIRTYDRLIGALMEEERAGEAFEYAERARARAFLARLGGARVNLTHTGGAVPSELLAAERVLRRQIIRLENVREHPLDQPEDRPKTAADIERRLDLARREYVRVLESIATARGGESPTLSAATAAGLAEIQSTLRTAGATLVEYHLTPGRGYAWVVDGRSLRSFELSAGALRLESLVNALRSEVAMPSNPKGYEEPAAALYEILVEPVLPHLAGRRVLLAPHGSLHHLPFAALLDRATGRHLAEDLSWSSIPSASSLRFAPAARSRVPRRPLVLGDPDGSLPAARRSAQRVADLLGVEPLLGPAATEGALRDRLAESDLIHLEVHAEFHATDPLFSRMHLANSSAPAVSSRDDGRLKLLEIEELDLDHVVLITLAACETALGFRSSGDDVSSLQRAFLARGAGHVVSTLWSVEDESTAAWSGAFYRRLRDGEAVPEALTGAQRELLASERWHHPYFWAGFVASGTSGAHGP